MSNIVQELWMAVILVSGFLMGSLIQEKTKEYIGGILATPLLAIYLVHAFPGQSHTVLLIFSVAFILCIATAKYFQEKFLVYGRRILYLMASTSVFVTVLFNVGLNWFFPPILSIVPAIIAYHYWRCIQRKEELVYSPIVLWAIVLLSLFIEGILVRGALTWLSLEM